MATHIEPARTIDADAVLQLVVQNGLPVDGLREHLAAAARRPRRLTQCRPNVLSEVRIRTHRVC